jgi:hypothetical protein
MYAAGVLWDGKGRRARSVETLLGGAGAGAGSERQHGAPPLQEVKFYLRHVIACHAGLIFQFFH